MVLCDIGSIILIIVRTPSHHYINISLIFLLQKHLFSGLLRAGAKLKELDLSDNALGPIGVEGMVDFMSSPVCYSLEVS